MTPERLREAEARYQRALARANTIRFTRDQLVRDAIDAGWTHATIAEAMGLSRGRVNQIARGRR